MSSTNTNIDDLINKLPNDALTPEAADALGRTESFEPAPAVDAVQPVTTEAVQQAPTGGGKKTFKRKGGRKHRRKTHKKNKRRSSKRRQ